FDPETGRYDPSSWNYQGMSVATDTGAEKGRAAGGEAHGSGGAKLAHGAPPNVDPTLEHPRCVFQLLRRHYRRYTPELVEQACGVPKKQFLAVAEALCANSGRERTSAFCYAVGWTPPSVGVQYIRPAPRWGCTPPPPPPSPNCCWATSAGPAAGSWPCAATPPSRAPPTSPPSTTCCPATSRCRPPPPHAA